jgi:hypothetical protein
MNSSSSGRGEGVLAALEQLDRPSPPQPAGAAQMVATRPSYRRGIRSRGPLLAVVFPTLVAGAGLMLLRGNESTAHGLLGFALVVLGAPLLTVAGVPLRSGAGVYAAAAAGSALLWFCIGVVAARRATRDAIATWRKFWGEYLVLLMAVWAGTVLALVAANLVLGRALI